VRLKREGETLTFLLTFAIPLLFQIENISEDLIGMIGEYWLLFLMILCLVLLFGTYLVFNGYLSTPDLSDFVAKCPASAVQTSLGVIATQPGNKTFTSLESYNEYYKYLASMGVECSYVTPSPKEYKKELKEGKDVTDTVQDEQTYALTPIKKLDDYEFSRVFQVEKESRNELERTTVNALTAQRQFDWSQLPYNSSGRAGHEQEMNGKRVEGFTATVTEPFYSSLSGDSLMPRDEQELDEKERAILQQYSPKKTEDLMAHDTDDIKALVSKLYESDANWEPVVEKKSDTEFEVIGLKAKPRKADAEYEDEKIPSVQEALESGQATGGDIFSKKTGSTVVPGMEVSGKQDPYFDKQGVLDYEGDRFYRYDSFAKWTPGLERMFAPTFDQNDWIHE
jgi:hypothetical protein